jgi:hypothetical protein
MPYITPELRRDLDPLIDALAGRLAQQAREADSEGAFAGPLNYALTRLALSTVHLRFGKLSYWLIATLTGIFQNLGQEFYRRLAAPYEDQAIIRNGDVEVVEELLRKMAQP